MADLVDLAGRESATGRTGRHRAALCDLSRHRRGLDQARRNPAHGQGIRIVPGVSRRRRHFREKRLGDRQAWTGSVAVARRYVAGISNACELPGLERNHSGYRVLTPFEAAMGAAVWGPTMQDLPMILVVEDDHLIQSLAEEALGDGGFETAVVAAGEEALNLLSESKTNYRALVTDINLGQGRMDGWEVARRAREMEAEFPVVYMSGDGAADWSSKGVPNSVMLEKPFAPAQLVTAVSQLLNTGKPAT